MKLKEMIKRFWTLDVHNHEGFTLVELIIVIAILAILSSVAVVGYSSYIKKANMQADRTLMSEMKNAIILALYADSNHTFDGDVLIKITASGAEVDCDDAEDKAFAEKALAAAYGEDWSEVCALKYTGWTSEAADAITAYLGSSYDGQEDLLLEKVGSLTGAMAGFFSERNSFPGAITSVLEANGVNTSDPTALANGAVSALATELSGLDATTRKEITDILCDMTSANQKNIDLQAVYHRVYADIEDDDERNDMVLLATASTLYAYIEAYSQYAIKEHSYQKPANILNNIKYTEKDPTTGEEKYLSSSSILANIVSAFNQVNATASDPNGGKAVAMGYLNSGSAGTDAKALFAVMDALADSSDVLNANLTNGSFYSDGTAADLLTAYITVGSKIVDGEAAIMILKNKNVLAYLGGMCA